MINFCLLIKLLKISAPLLKYDAQCADSSHFLSETEQENMNDVILNKDNGGKREGGDIELIITLVPKVL